MDPIIAGYLAYASARHEEADQETDMRRLAARMGVAVRRHAHSFYDHAGHCAHLRTDASGRAAREELAHELGHAVALEGRPSYDSVVRHYHASTPDIDAHVESLTDHAADRFLMSDAVVRQALRRYGYSGRAVWELMRLGRVGPERAVRRLVHFEPDRWAVAFYAEEGVVLFVEKTGRCWLPFWKGDPLPPRQELADAGISLYQPRDGVEIGVLVEP